MYLRVLEIHVILISNLISSYNFDRDISNNSLLDFHFDKAGPPMHVLIDYSQWRMCDSQC